MNKDVVNVSQSLPDKIRKEHIPANGDIYLETSRGYEGIIRLSERTKTPNGVYFTRENWDFAKKEWVKCAFDTISENSLKEGHYYKLCLVPLDELLSETEKMFNGQTFKEDVEETDTTELVTMGSKLSDMLTQTQMLEDRMETLETVLNARVNELQSLLEERMKPLKALVQTTKKQLRNIYRAISIIEVYQGENVEVLALCEGNRASEDTPVTIRQRILFMDEECAVLDETGQGLDYWTRDRFYDWIKKPSHRNIILPEERCVVVAKPRRYDKQYSSDFYEQRRINEWNKHSFVFLRNGENVYVVESDNLCIYGTAVPRKADYESIEKEAEHWKENAQEHLESLNYRCIHFAMVLQGINDRTDIFAPHKEINFIRNIGTQIIFDDEEGSLLGTDRLNFREWLKGQSRTIRRGSRVLFIRGFSGGKPMRWEYRGDAYNNYAPRIAAPETGLYTVEEKQGGKLGITYLPADYWGERSRRETWLIDTDTVINYDTVKAEDIRGYLEDRTQRRYYQGIIPLLRKYELELSKEQDYEGLFLSALKKVLDERHISYTAESIQDALLWWKTKVIHIRPIQSDDNKAWRMIIGYLKNKNNEV